MGHKDIPPAVPKLDFLRAVDLGLYGGTHYIFRRFGFLPTVTTTTDPEDVWDVLGTKTYPTTAGELTIVSDDAADVAAGTGARTVKVWYLDGDYVSQSAEVTLTGATPVVVAAEAIRFVRALVLTAGSGGQNAGPLTAKIGATTVGQINDTGYNQTLQSHYTVPAGYTAYLLAYHISQDGGASNTLVALKARPFGGVFNTKVLVSMEGTATTVAEEQDILGQSFEEKTDIKVEVLQVSQTVSVSASYTLLVVKN